MRPLAYAQWVGLRGGVLGKNSKKRSVRHAISSKMAGQILNEFGI